MAEEKSWEEVERKKSFSGVGESMAALAQLSLCFHLFVKNSSHNDEIDFVSLLPSGTLGSRFSDCNKITYTFPGIIN